jgi:hypothetical protein
MCGVWRVTCDVWRVTCDVSRVMSFDAWFSTYNFTMCDVLYNFTMCDVLYNFTMCDVLCVTLALPFRFLKLALDIDQSHYPERASSPSTRNAPHVPRHTSHVTRSTSHVTRHTSHVTRHTSHVTHHPSHLTRPGSRHLRCQCSSHYCRAVASNQVLADTCPRIQNQATTPQLHILHIDIAA